MPVNDSLFFTFAVSISITLKYPNTEALDLFICVVIVGLAVGYFLNTKIEDLKIAIEPTPIVEVVEEAGPYD